MKNGIMILLMIGVFHTLASAQNLTVGLRAGITASSYWKMTQDEGGNRLLNQPQIGVLVAYPLTERLHVQAELNYAPKGDRWYFDYESGRREQIRDVYNYLEIPILAKYQILENPLHVYGIGGFYVARALSNKYTEDETTKEIQNYVKGDFGVQLGGGATLPIGPGKAFAELRLIKGFKDLDVFRDETVTRLNAVNLSVGYIMELK